MPPKKTKEHREHPRHPMRWEVAVVFDEKDNRPKFHGRTYDISVQGASIVTDTNVFATQAVTILLAIPPLNHGERKTIVEIRARMRYTVLSSSLGAFRIGFHFEHFKGDGRALLARHLAERALGRDIEGD